MCRPKNEEEKDRFAHMVTKTLENARIEADVLVILSMTSKEEMLRQNSSDADCIFINIDLPKADNSVEWYAEIDQQIDGLPTTILVHSTIKSDILI